MRGHDELTTVVREWLVKAENDLKNATHTLKLGKECPTDTVCFHAQQCAEKYLKALLVWRCIQFPRSHAIGELLRLLPPDARPVLTSEEQERLTEYATVTRYPGTYEPISLNEARNTVKLVRRIRREIRRLLPNEVKGKKESNLPLL